MGWSIQGSSVRSSAAGSEITSQAPMALAGSAGAEIRHFARGAQFRGHSVAIDGSKPPAKHAQRQSPITSTWLERKSDAVDLGDDCKSPPFVRIHLKPTVASIAKARASDQATNTADPLGIQRVTARNAEALLPGLFSAIEAKSLSRRKEDPSKAGPCPIAGISQKLALHLKSLEPPLARWDEVMLQALVKQHTMNTGSDCHYSLWEVLQGMSSVMEPNGFMSSPQLLARVLGLIKKTAREQFPERPPEHWKLLIAALAHELSRYREALGADAITCATQYDDPASFRAARSPMQLAQIIKEMMRAVEDWPVLADIVREVITDVIEDTADSFRSDQLAAMGTSLMLMAVKKNAAEPDFRQWKQCVDEVIQKECQQEDLAFGMRVGLNPALAMAHPQWKTGAKVDLLVTTLQLGGINTLASTGELLQTISLNRNPRGRSETVSARTTEFDPAAFKKSEVISRIDGMLDVLASEQAHVKASDFGHVSTFIRRGMDIARELELARPKRSRLRPVNMLRQQLNLRMIALYDLAACRLGATQGGAEWAIFRELEIQNTLSGIPSQMAETLMKQLHCAGTSPPPDQPAPRESKRFDITPGAGPGASRRAGLSLRIPAYNRPVVRRESPISPELSVAAAEGAGLQPNAQVQRTGDAPR